MKQLLFIFTTSNLPPIRDKPLHLHAFQECAKLRFKTSLSEITMVTGFNILKTYTKKIKNIFEEPLLVQLEKPKSTIGFKYPTLRDHPLASPSIWLEGKRADDGAEGLWRVHDGLYDFTNFIDSHPGGADWLELTKGTDITEAFEIHHLSNLPEKYLKSYFVRKAVGARNSPFTFEDDGFYKTLKRRVKDVLLNVPETAALRSKLLTDSMCFGFLLTAVLAIKLQSYATGIVSATLLTMTCIAAHNFLHQKDNFRMYYLGLTFMSYRDFRVSHALSHHIYPNTVYDLEISSVEPYLQYMPNKKNFFARYISWIYSPIFYASFYVGYYMKGLVNAANGRRKLNKEDYTSPLLFIFLFLIGGQTFPTTIKFFFWIEFISSFLFALIGLAAGHHHPDVFHDGDAARPKEERDWGLHQVDSVMDRIEIIGSHFLVLISFGDHALHHLFPSVDHGKLEYLYPVFEATCKDFGLEFRTATQVECFKGQLRQLAKIEPNRNPPELKQK